MALKPNERRPERKPERKKRRYERPVLISQTIEAPKLLMITCSTGFYDCEGECIPNTEQCPPI